MKAARLKSLALLIALVSFGVASCDEDTILVGNTNLSFKFSHNWDGSTVDNSTFDQTIYINARGDTMSITKLRYLISDLILTSSTGNTVTIDGYLLADVTAGTGLTLEVDGAIPAGTYTGLKFTWGFDEADNVEDAYPDLNLANWNWPDMLGGGYHFMQMEGNYLNNGVAMPYAYHNGTARVSEGVFEQNFFEVSLSGFTLNKSNAEIEIQMDISEWYENPNLWDIRVLNTMLMPNYDAQKMMQANGASVFSLGSIIQEN